MSASESAVLERHQHSVLPFSCAVPAGWERTEELAGCALVMFEPERGDPHFRANAVITVELLEPGRGPAEWIEASRAAVVASLNRARVLDVEPAAEQGRGVPAERTLIHYVHQELGGVTLEQWARVHGVMGFVVSCSGAALEYDDLADLNLALAAGLQPR